MPVSWDFNSDFLASMTRYIFITGGVVSSLGKGIAAACLGAILQARGLNVTMMKLDPNFFIKCFSDQVVGNQIPECFE